MVSVSMEKSARPESDAAGRRNSSQRIIYVRAYIIYVFDADRDP